MAVLSRDEARRARARKHASRLHTCSVCGHISKGNGGSTSHKRKHVREWMDGKSMLGLPEKTQLILQGWIRKYAGLEKRARSFKGTR